MVGDESDPAQRHGGLTARRAVIGVALLAWLAGRTWQESAVWTSEEHVWITANERAPLASRPLINLAALHGDDEALLQRAASLAAQQPEQERTWALDQIAARRINRLLAEGELLAAGRLMATGPKWSARWDLCQQYRVICGSASLH